MYSEYSHRVGQQLLQRSDRATGVSGSPSPVREGGVPAAGGDHDPPAPGGWRPQSAQITRALHVVQHDEPSFRRGGQPGQ